MNAPLFASLTKLLRRNSIQCLLAGTCISLLACFPLLFDLETYFVFRDWVILVYWAELLRSTIVDYGQVPFWNPYECSGGNPFLAHGEASWGLNPLVLPFILFFKPIVGIKFAIVIHYIIGYAGMYSFVWFFTQKRISSFYGAGVYTFCGTFVQHIVAGHLHWFCFFYTPWFYLCFFRSRTQRHFVIPAAVLLFLMVVGGQAHASGIISITCMGLLAIVFAVYDRNLVLVRNVFWIIFLAFAFGMFRIPYTLEMMSLEPRILDYPESHGLRDLLGTFLFQTRLVAHNIYHFSVHGFHENCHYLGMLPCVVFAFAAFKTRRRTWPLLVVIACLITIALGHFATFSPYTILKKLSLYESTRVAARFHNPVVILMALVGSLFLSETETAGKEKSSHANVLLWIITAAVTSNLAFYTLTEFWFFSGLVGYKDLLTVPKNVTELVEKHRDKPFAILPIAKEGRLDMLEALKENRGVVNCDNSGLNIGSFAAPVESSDYRGEVYLRRGDGRAEIVKWTPNYFTVKVETAERDLLVVNQNFHRYWRRRDGRSVEGFGGLISTRVGPDTSKVEFEYYPSYWWLAFIGSMLSLLIAGVVFFRCHRLAPKSTEFPL